MLLLRKSWCNVVWLGLEQLVNHLIRWNRKNNQQVFSELVQFLSTSKAKKTAYQVWICSGYSVSPIFQQRCWSVWFLFCATGRYLVHPLTWEGTFLYICWIMLNKMLKDPPRLYPVVGPRPLCCPSLTPLSILSHLYCLSSCQIMEYIK